jgi:hypothetical protein
MIEAILRRVFKAPTIVVQFEEDKNLPQWSITLGELEAATIGVETGEIALVSNEPVTVLPGDGNTAAESVIGYVGTGAVHVRRQIMSRITRHLIGGAWTIAGMVIVIVTLSGAARMIALFLCVIAFVVDLMSIAIRRP